MASKKSKILAIAFCAAVMAGIHVNPVLAYYGQEDFNYQHNTTESGLNNPEIHHTADEGKFRPDWEPVHPEGDVNCEEEVANSNITVGDMNKVTADLVANDEKNYSDVKDLQEQVDKIWITADTDTHVKEGAATVDENGNVTMDIVDKDGKDTGKDVTISGLASDSELATETQNRTDSDTKLQGQINDVNTVTGAANKGELDAAYSGTNYIEGSASMVEADRKLDAAISDVNSRVDGIENRVDGLEDRIDKVGAMSAAIANLRTMGYDPAAPTEVAVGVGQYRDETGMALGLFHYPNRDFMLSLSVSTSGDEYMGGIGATWKFGRKSPEKVAEIKKAQAEADARRAEEQKLAKAEEMKKAAKEAKVQAQMERHAKLAAERAALEEA